MNKPPLKPTLLQLASLLLFTAVLMLLIPPVPSDTQTTYNATPAIFVAAALFASSSFIARRATPDPIWKIAAQTIVFILYGTILFERLQVR